MLHDEGLDDYVCRVLHLDRARARPHRVARARRPGARPPTETVRIGLVGKYINLPDAYLSVVEALKHGGYACGAQGRDRLDRGRRRRGAARRGPPARPRRHRDPRRLRHPRHRGQDRRRRLRPRARRPVPRPVPRPALRGDRVRPRRVRARRRQLARVRPAHARTRSSTSWTSSSDVVDMGGTMRLGAYPAQARCPASIVRDGLRRRGRLRAPPSPLRGQQPLPRRCSRSTAWCCSGTSPDGLLVEFVELPPTMHPFFVATQAHPEFKSRPEPPAPAVRRVRAGAPASGPRAALPRLPLLDRRRPAGAAVTDATRVPRSSASRDARATPGSCRSTRVHVAAPDGEEFDRHVVHHPGAVVVVPVDRRRRALLRAPVPRRRRPRAARGAGRQARRRRRAARGDRATASSRRRSAYTPGRLELLVRVLQLARLLRRVHLPVPRHRARGVRRAAR